METFERYFSSDFYLGGWQRRCDLCPRHCSYETRGETSMHSANAAHGGEIITA